MSKTRGLPRYLWPDDHQRTDYRGNTLRDAAAKQLAEFRGQGMPSDLAGALRWIAARSRPFDSEDKAKAAVDEMGPLLRRV